jgi:hypothetical protein
MDMINRAPVPRRTSPRWRVVSLNRLWRDIYHLSATMDASITNDTTIARCQRIKNVILEGIDPRVLFHAMAAEGLIDTAVKSVTGETPIIVMEDGGLSMFVSEIDRLSFKRKLEGCSTLRKSVVWNFDIENDIPTTDEHGNVAGDK